MDELSSKNEEKLLIDMLKERKDIAQMKDNTGVSVLPCFSLVKGVHSVMVVMKMS